MITALPVIWLQWQLAMDMRNIMDTNVDPCVNFYDFACGNYENLYPLTDDKSRMNLPEQAHDQIVKELRVLMEDDDKFDDPDSTLLVKRFYRSCMDEDKLEELGNKPIKKFIKKYGGWPVVEGKRWNESEYDWIKLNALLKTSIKEEDFLQFTAGADFKDSKTRILFIDQASLGLGKREFYLENANKEILNSYLQFMTTTATQLGASKAAAKDEMNQLLEFETALAEVMNSVQYTLAANAKDEDRRDLNELYHPITVKELKEEYPKINFELWFNTAAEHGWSFKDTDRINLSGKPFLDKLTELLAKFPARWEECVAATMTALELPVGSMYVRRYFSEDTKRELEEIMANIREAMRSTIENVNWMDTLTKRSAQEKLSNMIQSIAFPSPDIYNETWIMRDYKKADIKPYSYLNNFVSLAVSKRDRFMKEFSEPINRTDWVGAIAEANAWFRTDMNKMTFPAGILRYPFYSPVAPNYFNYGRVAAVMGHELTHGFDDEGRQYDAKGNFELWWSIETLAKFKKGAKCFIDEYSKIKDAQTGLKLNGENTQGENIADNGGLKLAYKAYQMDKENNLTSMATRNEILRGFENFTAEQLFFVSYAQVWCTNIRKEAIKSQIISDPHAPAMYRVNVPLQNHPDFATVFNCRVGSPMNPAEKCQLW